MKTSNNHRTRMKGFTLLEAMIAMLVLSIGLLGLAGLQAAGSRLSNEAHLRSITTLAASEIIERIRARTGKLSRADRPAVIQQYAASESENCVAANSDIDNDMGCWRQNIQNELPEGNGAITDNGDGSFTITISWYDRTTEDANSVNWTFIAGALL